MQKDIEQFRNVLLAREIAAIAKVLGIQQHCAHTDGRFPGCPHHKGGTHSNCWDSKFFVIACGSHTESGFIGQ